MARAKTADKKTIEAAAPEGTNSYIMNPRQVASQWVKGEKGGGR